MKSFRELLTALMPDCDGTADLFRVNCGDHEVTVREGKGNAALEVWDGERCARREYDYDEAYKVLSALRNGTARLNAWFPPVHKPKKAGGLRAGKITGILLGVVMALGAGFCGFAVLMTSIFGTGISPLANVAMQFFFCGMLIAGIALVVSCAKGTLSVKSFFGVGVSFVMSTTLVSLILGIWSTRADDPETPLHVYIALTVAFGIFAAMFAVMVIYTLAAEGRSSPSTGCYRQPGFRVEPSAQTLAPVMAAIRERTACEAIRIKLDFDRQPALFDSKLGGLPYWDTAVPYPCDEETGDKLALLAQINLSQLPQNDFLPREGMLQFFIRPDIEYGLTSTKKVVYHSTVNHSVYSKEIKALDLPGSETVEYGDFPVTGELAMDFETVTAFMTTCDRRFDGLLDEVAAEMGIELFDGASYEIIDDCKHNEGTEGHLIGGYPYFTQYDPRTGEERDKYDFLLLQIDTDDRADRRDKAVMWGDAGVGQFFINREALREMNLDDIYYTWDCC